MQSSALVSWGVVATLVAVAWLLGAPPWAALAAGALAGSALWLQRRALLELRPTAAPSLAEAAGIAWRIGLTTPSMVDGHLLMQL